MRRLLLIIYALVCFTFFVQSQRMLKGNVQDEMGTGVFSTTLRIFMRDSTFLNGSITDDDGAFTFINIKPGRYILGVSNIGYVSQFIDFEMPDKDYKLPPIVLETDIVSLSEVVVKGSTFIRKKDHLLVIPDKQQKKHAFSGYDLLYNLMIPGLNVDRKSKIVTALAGTVTLYINGIEADFREIQNLRPTDIEKVQYYSLPTGKYVGDAASINYITKEYETGGYVTLEGEQNIGYLKGSYDLAAKILRNNTNITFFGGYNIKNYAGLEKEKSEELFFSEYTVHRNRATESADFSNNQQYAQFKVSNDTEKHNLSGRLFFVRNETPHNDCNEMLDYIGYNAQHIQSSEKVNSKNLKPAVSLNGVFRPTEKQQLKFDLNGSYTQNKYNRIYTEKEKISFTTADEDFYSFSVSGKYMNQLNVQNTFSVNLSHYHNISSSDYSGDYKSWQHLWKGETLLFLTYIREFGESATFYVNPGLSLLNYKLYGDELQRFWTTRLNTWIRYRVNPQHWLGGGFSMGNHQPNISSLNSMDQTIDFYQIKRGNPDLENTISYMWYFMYEGQISPFNVQYRLWYDKYDNNIFPCYYLEKDKLISSYRSDGSFNTVNSDLSVSCRILESLRVKFGLKYNYMYVPDESDLSRNNFTGSLDVNYFLKSFVVNAYIRTQEKSIQRNTLAYMSIPSSHGFSIRYNSKKWMAEVGTENPFTKHARYRKYADYEVYKYNQVQDSRIYQQTGYIKLAYTFDFGKNISREDNSVNKSINSAILKVE